MEIYSSEFTQGQPIPIQCGCKGESFSPALSWKDVPASAKSLALVCDDPDAPGRTFLHWLVVNIPPHASGVAGGAGGGALPPGAVQLLNSSGQKDYTGPCPPSGTHHYHFKLYALDIPTLSTVNRKNYETELAKHALARADLMGTYSH